jgi:hypothetical protein
MGKKSRSGSGNIPDHISEGLETVFWVKIIKFLDADADPASGIFLTRDPGSEMETFGYGIRDKHPGQQHFLKTSQRAGRSLQSC